MVLALSQQCLPSDLFMCTRSTEEREAAGVTLLLLSLEMTAVYLKGVRKQKHLRLPSQKGRVISNPTIQNGGVLNNVYNNSPPTPASPCLDLDAEPSVELRAALMSSLCTTHGSEMEGCPLLGFGRL